MQRFSPQSISQLQQIGLAFFEKIATDSSMAGETQDFYQGLLVGLDWAVRLLQEDKGIETLKSVEARLASLIDLDCYVEGNQNPSSASPIHRLPLTSIAELQHTNTDTAIDEDILACVPTCETQDFYHGCLAALAFSISLESEKYAYAQISLLKTNAAYWIELSSQSDRQIYQPMPQERRWANPRHQKRFSALLPTNQGVAMGEVDSPLLSEESPELETANLDVQEDEYKVKVGHFPEDSEEQERCTEASQLQDHRLETEKLLVEILLYNFHQLNRLEKQELTQDWTVILEEGESIRVVSREDNHVVFKMNSEGEVQSPLSNSDSEKLRAKINPKNPEDLATSQLLAHEVHSSFEILNPTLELEQIKQAELILPIAQKVFEFRLNSADEEIVEIPNSTLIEIAKAYQLVVTEVEGVSVSSLNASGRGELIRVCGEDLVFAQGIQPEDVEFWLQIAEDLNTMERQFPQKSSGMQL